MCSTGWFQEHDCKKVQLPFYLFKWYFCQNDKKPCKGKIGINRKKNHNKPNQRCCVTLVAWLYQSDMFGLGF